jgi:hypothetical protein
LTRPEKGFKNFYKFDGQADCCCRLKKNELFAPAVSAGIPVRSGQDRIS